MTCNAANWREVLERECGIPADGWVENGAGIWENSAVYSVIEPRPGRKGTVIVAPNTIHFLQRWSDLPRVVKALQAGAKAIEAVLSGRACDTVHNGCEFVGGVCRLCGEPREVTP